MARIVIIGNSAAGFSCCDTLSKNSQDAEITVISQENYPAYKRNLLIDYLAGGLKEEALFLCSPDFYEKNKIKFLRNSKVIRVDTKKQSVILKDNNKINYDYLVIATGQKMELPDLPGKTKEGIFTVWGLEEIKKIKERLTFCSEVCITGEAKLCLRICEVISRKDKDIKIISRPRPVSFIPAEKKEWIDNSELTEFIGEGAELKAFKLNNGKAISASLVLFAADLSPASEFLKETEIKTIQGYIIVDEAMRTNFENIFACGSVCRKEESLEKEKSWEEAVNEGASVASAIANLLERGKTICQQTY
jgi:NAD(P)H-nitrite reductase large subunit